MLKLLATLRLCRTTWIRYRLSRQIQRGTLDPAPETTDFFRLRRDIEASLDDIGLITARHAGPCTLLPKRMALLGLDSTLLAQHEGDRMHALRSTCRQCRHWRRCGHELSAARPAELLPTYCANAPALRALTHGQHRH